MRIYTEHKLYCGKCKSKENLGRNCKNKWVFKNGDIKYIQYYYCRKCNTERLKNYRATPNGAKRVRIAVYKSIAKFPEKQVARQKVSYALRIGKLIKPNSCEFCNHKIKVEAHHSDYEQPLLVTWLCRNCHTVV